MVGCATRVKSVRKAQAASKREDCPPSGWPLLEAPTSYCNHMLETRWLDIDARSTLKSLQHLIEPRAGESPFVLDRQRGKTSAEAGP